MGVRHAVRVLLLDERELEAEVWQRRHVFSWRGVDFDQRERWFLARVANFEPDLSGVSDAERIDLTDWRWWTLQALRRTTDEFVPRDLASRLAEMLEHGPPASAVPIGT